MSDPQSHCPWCSRDHDAPEMLELQDTIAKQDKSIGELQAENIKLWHNLRDAMEWNWLDDDAPERFDLDIYHVQTRSAENE